MVVDFQFFGYSCSIIYSTVNGYGLTGPFSEYPTFDPLIQAQSGAMRDQGGDGDPVFLRVAASDYCSAILSAYAIAAALFHRSETGEGQQIEVPLINSAFAYQFEEYFNYPGKTDKARLADVGTSVGYRLYKAIDGWFFLSCESPTDWTKLCDTLQRPDLKKSLDPSNHETDPKDEEAKIGYLLLSDLTIYKSETSKNTTILLRK